MKLSKSSERLCRTLEDIPIWTCSKCSHKITLYEFEAWLYIRDNPNTSVRCSGCGHVDAPLQARTYHMQQTRFVNSLGLK